VHHRHNPLLVATELPQHLVDGVLSTYMSNSNDVLVIQ
jgi:hypothetical protein